ncbi:MAG: hypothetical protein RBT73_02955 [Spirochaetia bacterium]|nr:hypothetical protein [Spirochaetia bacterium]
MDIQQESSAVLGIRQEIFKEKEPILKVNRLSKSVPLIMPKGFDSLAGFMPRGLLRVYLIGLNVYRIIFLPL